MTPRPKPRVVTNNGARAEVQAGRCLKWEAIRRCVTTDMRDLSGAAALFRWFLLAREEGSSCTNWLQIQDTALLALEAHHFRIPASVRMQFIVNQLSAHERTLLRVPADNELEDLFA